jgi:hypothetical protein
MKIETTVEIETELVPKTFFGFRYFARKFWVHQTQRFIGGLNDGRHLTIRHGFFKNPDRAVDFAQQILDRHPAPVVVAG